MLYLTGLTRWFDTLLADLAEPGRPVKALFASIAQTSRNIEHHLSATHVRVAQLTARSRAIRGWLAFFAQRPQFDRYVTAVRAATAAFEAFIARRAAKRFPLPVRVQYRPMRGLYSLRGQPGGTRVLLPTPMICFDGPLLAEVAKLALGRRRAAARLVRPAHEAGVAGPAGAAGRRAVLETLAGPPCQTLAAELESLGGVVERTAGRRHDLLDSFRRVNLAYFEGRLARPRLTWSRLLTRRKFGHYEHLGDTVMISVSLDQPDVPDFVVDYVMYHELLHKRHGITWRNGQARVHTPQFKREDRRFARYGDADAMLKQLSRRRG